MTAPAAPVRQSRPRPRDRAELALDKDGVILALRLSGYGNAGAYPVAPLPYSVMR